MRWNGIEYCQFRAFLLADLVAVVCMYKLVDSIDFGKKFNTCVVNQAIDSEHYVLESGLDTTVGQFYISENKKVKFLPANIGEKFPNLKEFRVWGCGLTVLRDFYFQNMTNVKYLDLGYNRISNIESSAFKDLVNLEHLFLNNNMIETLHENLFVTMVKLQLLFLADNKIKLLSPASFKIPRGKLGWVDLRDNTCINDDYVLRNFGQLEAQIKANCTQ